MNILSRLFWLPFNDRVVDDAVIPGLAKSLGAFVKAQGLAQVQLSDDLLDELLAEAIGRAEANEPGSKPCYRALWQKIEEVADAAARIYKGDEDPDTKVAAIFRKYEPRCLKSIEGALK
jgi:hypothetical protein